MRRDEGAPINEIARRVGVAKSSVSLWVRDIELTTEQRNALLERNPAFNRQLSGWTKLAARAEPSVNVYSKYSKRKRVGNLPFGTCRVVVSRTWVTQTIFGAIQEIGGFEREAWLE